MFRQNKGRVSNVDVIHIDSPENNNLRRSRRSNHSNRSEVIDVDELDLEEISQFIDNDDIYVPSHSNSQEDSDEQDSTRRRYPLRSRNTRNSTTTQTDQIIRRGNSSRGRRSRSHRRSRNNQRNVTHRSPQPYTLQWWLQQIDIDDIPDIDFDSYEGRLLLDELVEKKGLEEYEIDQLPVIKHENGSSYDKECAICLDEYKENDELIVLYCIHVFHKDCISRWLRENKTCPSCRKQVLENS